MMHVSLNIPNNLTEPAWGPMGEDVYKRTYSRTKKDGTREDWKETVQRVVLGNCNFVPAKYIEKGEPEKLFDLIYNFGLLPGGRHLWVTGVPGRSFIGNCFSSGWDETDFSKHFAFGFARLMEGGGVGSNYSNSYFKSYGKFSRKVELHFVCDPVHPDYKTIAQWLSKAYSADWAGAFQIEDSREGWVESLVRVIKSHTDKLEDMENGDLILDVSRIRPCGSKLKTFGGVASGPSALVDMLCEINKLLNEYYDKKPDSALAMLIDHHIGRCVVAGSIRRSSRMAMKHWKDEDIFDFIKCKEDGKAHWTTNVSVVVDSGFWRALRKKDAYAQKVLKAIASGMLKNGEPGIFNITKAQEGEVSDVYSTNPCFAYETHVYTKDGRRAIGLLAESNKKFKVWDGSDWVFATAFKSGVKAVIRLIFESRYSIILTPDHKLSVDNGIEILAKDSLNRCLDCLTPPGYSLEQDAKVIAIEDAGIMDVYDFHMEKTHWASVEGFRMHNCGEIAGPPWFACCLGSVNLAKFANKPVSELLEAFRLMTRFLIRATFSDCYDKDTKAVIERERRIGVGISGFADWQILEGHTYSHFPNCETQKNKLKAAADCVRTEARNYAFQLRIPEPVKVTTAAPAGTTSKLCGISEGIQPILFKYFKRRVMYGVVDENQRKIVEKLTKSGHFVEDSAYTPDTKVVTYFCQTGVLGNPEVQVELVEDSTEITLEECLAVQKTIQEIYVDNCVSFTINVSPEEYTEKQIARALVAFGPDLKGTTIMPIVSNRAQMPYEKITKEEYEQAQHKYVGAGEAECKNGVCQLVIKTDDEKV